jgi:tetratricopeptide (TPR) repeat protein
MGLPLADLIDREIRARGLTGKDAATAIRRLSHHGGDSLGATRTSPETFSRWRNGTAIPDPYSLRLIAEFLALPIREVTAVAEAQRMMLAARGARPASLRDVSHTSDQVPPIDSEAVKRREFVKLGAVSLAGIATGLDVERALAAWAATQVDSKALDVLAAMTRRLMEQETAMQPDDLLPAVDQHLRVFPNVLFWTPAGLAASAYAAAGETALLAGFLAFKLNRRAEADFYWSHAERFAETAGHVNLQAALLALQSWRWEDEDRLRALGLLDRAAAPAVSSLIHSWRAAFSTAGSTAGLLTGGPGRPVGGESARRALLDVDAAEHHLGRVDHGDAPLYIIESIKWEVTESRGLCLLSLDRPAEALADFERVLGWLDAASPSYRSLMYVDLGVTHVKLGNPEQACQMLGSALRLSEEAGAPYRQRMVGLAHQRWLARYDLPEVRALSEQLGPLAR